MTKSPTALSFTHVGPARETSIEVPPPGKDASSYSLCFDEKARQMAYLPAPDYHTTGHVWRFDGAAWKQHGSSTYRVGSQLQPWRALWDAQRNAIVTWGWDSSAGAVGLVHNDDGTLTALLSESGAAASKHMAQTAPVVVLSGDAPTSEESTWDNIHGLFAFDRTRNVTVCLTQEGVWELDGTKWKKCADAGALEVLPKEAGADSLYNRAVGAGGVWDAPRKRVLFWVGDSDKDVFTLFTWDGSKLTKLAADGLPSDLIEGFDSGLAVGAHPEHGLVLWAGDAGMFGLAKDGSSFVKLDAGKGDVPKRGTAGRMAFDEERGALFLGPRNVNHTPQTTFFVRTSTSPGDGTWVKQGASTTKSVLANLSSGFIGWGSSQGAMHAASFYLKTAAWSDSDGWRLVVDEKTGDKVRGDCRGIAFTSAFDGALHAVMDDGSVFAFNGKTWERKAGESGLFKKLAWPLLAFDKERRLLVAWGADKAKGGRKDDTYVFDGKEWAKVKKPGAKAADADDKAAHFDLFYDAGRGAVVRLGKNELATFDGKVWTAQPLTNANALDSWRRLVCPHPTKGATLVVNIGDKTIARIDVDGTVTTVGTFAPPTKRKDHDNLPFDRCWYDAAKLRLVVHSDDNDRDNFALDLAPLFGG